ncbi:MAG: CfrBI family restriction endonuclease [Nitrosomonadaceae bacterium]|nr:CfrBI family restriction endonuclease [Nitrosomonadaceae bacterium]
MKPLDLVNLYPKSGQELLNAGGKELIEKLGIETIRQVVLAVMKGENLRNRTELLTRRKIAISSGALLLFFINGLKSDPDFINKLPERALNALRNGKLTKQQRWIINWILGLTDKAVQNVLRDNIQGSSQYHINYDMAMKEVAIQLETDYGALSGNLKLEEGNKNHVTLDWLFILHLLGAAGTQAMTIRGSDKSTYGKLFERLILGSLLHILGFELINRSKPVSKHKMVFWLSDRQEKRESDATALIKTGVGVRFDIGFIGRGNSEISLDKVSRFEREMEFGRANHLMSTFIIVDRIGVRSRLQELAKNINGTVVQMSMSYWPKEVAQNLSKIGDFSHALTSINDSEIDEFLTEAIKEVPLKDLLPDNFELESDDDNEE